MAAKQITFKLSGLKQPFIMLTDSVDQEFGQSTEEMTCLYFIMPGVSAGRLTGWGWNPLEACALTYLWWSMLAIG